MLASYLSHAGETSPGACPASGRSVLAHHHFDFRSGLDLVDIVIMVFYCEAGECYSRMDLHSLP